MEPSQNLYDYPKYYDLVFGSDWKSEFDFLLACFERYAKRPVQRVFEPACGTGRLLVKLADAGYEVAGNDLNAKAVEYCNRRLARRGHPATAVVGDMADFRVTRKFQAAFNMINSFRHLPSEAAARAHLKCTAEALVSGGLYVLGLHITPPGAPQCEEESWSARRGHLSVVSQMWSLGVDRRRRQERVRVSYDVYTPTRQMRLEDEMNFRTYTAAQFQRLLAAVDAFDLAETFDFAYDINEPVEIDELTEDVVYVLRKR